MSGGPDVVVEQFGPYRLEELLGRGGMGEVYRAFDTVKERTVALKRLPVYMANDAEFKARFRRESKLAAQLRQAHIIPIHDFGEIDGQLFIDMRLVDGKDLAALLAQQGALPPARAVHIVSQIASALNAAHAEGLVHRDIKPSNALISGSEYEPDYVYVVDFGVARTANSTGLTGTGAIIGTLDYMAPERFLTGHGDHRVDIYSLACLLYETLTARKPFPGEGLPAQMYAHVHLPPPAPTDHQPHIPAALDQVIAVGMAKDPEHRYQRVSDLAIAAHDAVSAPTIEEETRETVNSSPAATIALTNPGAGTMTRPVTPQETRVPIEVSHLPAPPKPRPRRRRQTSVIISLILAVLAGTGIYLLTVSRSNAPAPAEATRAVGAPSPSLLDNPIIRTVRGSVPKIRSKAPSCGKQFTGTGFVVGPQLVMTSADVVAGASETSVEGLSQGGRIATLGATIVSLDPDLNVAVLRIPDLAAQPLAFAPEPVSSGSEGLVLGYPLDGPYTVSAARVRERINLRGPNIYSSNTVIRKVYVIRAVVRNGNAGGPLISPNSGRVIGVVVGVARGDDETGFVLTADQVAPIVAAASTLTRGVDPGPCAAQ